MLLTSTVVSGKGSLSSTDALVGGSTGGSGRGVKPGASNGEFPVCGEHQVVCLQWKRGWVRTGLSSFGDGYLVLNVTFGECPGSRENIVQSALVLFPSEFLPAQFILSVAFI